MYKYTATPKEKTIEEILSDSAYLPESGAYQNAKKALEKLSRTEVQSIWAVVLCKRNK